MRPAQQFGQAGHHPGGFGRAEAGAVGHQAGFGALQDQVFAQALVVQAGLARLDQHLRHVLAQLVAGAEVIARQRQTAARIAVQEAKEEELRAQYDAAWAQLAWDRTFRFFGRTLA